MKEEKRIGWGRIFGKQWSKEKNEKKWRGSVNIRKSNGITKGKRINKGNKLKGWIDIGNRVGKSIIKTEKMCQFYFYL